MRRAWSSDSYCMLGHVFAWPKTMENTQNRHYMHTFAYLRIKTFSMKYVIKQNISSAYFNFVNTHCQNMHVRKANTSRLCRFAGRLSEKKANAYYSVTTV